MSKILDSTTIDVVVGEVREVRPKPKIIVLFGRHEPLERTTPIVENVNEIPRALFIKFPYAQTTKGFFLTLSDLLNEATDDLCKGTRIFGDKFPPGVYVSVGQQLKKLIEYDNSTSTRRLRKTLVCDHSACPSSYGKKAFNNETEWYLYCDLWEMLERKTGFIDNDELIALFRKNGWISRKTLFVDLHCMDGYVCDRSNKYNYWRFERRLREGIRNNTIAGVATPYKRWIGRILPIRRKLEKVARYGKPIRVSEFIGGDIRINNNYHYDEESFLIEFFQKIQRIRLELSEEEKRKIMPAVNFGYIFDHRLGCSSLLSSSLPSQEAQSHGKSLECFLENILAYHAHIVN